MTMKIDNTTRVCNKCGEEKILSEFVPAKQCLFGRSTTCYVCKRARRRELRADNLEERRKKDREYYQKTKDAQTLKQRNWKLNNKEQVAAYQKDYRENNQEFIKELKKKHRPRQNELDRERRKTDPKWKLNRTISNYIYQTIRGKKLGRHWEDLVGYSVDDLMSHLEKQFDNGMSWDNYGEWHIDHVTPIAAHNFTKPSHIDFKRCWSLDNLQPLWAKQNILKGTKVSKPFQPSLTM